jgi:hypothetical protein
VTKKAFIIAALGLAIAGPAHAQFGGCGDTQLDPCYVSDFPVETATEDMDTVQLPTIVQDEEEELLPGLAGGFAISEALSGDLEQQVSSAGGMPLTLDAISQYRDYWPGYSNAHYGQDPQPGSPEANMATTLGTLQGALNAGADQQESQAGENQRLYNLEGTAAAATGNLQVQEVSNEIALFQAQQEMKLRNALNGTLNAMLVAESNRQSQKAQDDLESLSVAGENVDDGFTQDDPQEPPVPTP